MTANILRITLFATAIVAFIAQVETANAQRKGRWNVNIFPKTEDNKPLRCVMTSPTDDGNRFRLTNVRLKELETKPNYLGSGGITVFVADGNLIPEDAKVLENQVIEIPGQRQWTTSITWKKRPKGGMLSFVLEDNVVGLISPIARGKTLEIELNTGDPANIQKILLSLQESWRATVAFETCLNS